jgi:hypothetical protein
LGARAAGTGRAVGGVGIGAARGDVAASAGPAFGSGRTNERRRGARGAADAAVDRARVVVVARLGAAEAGLAELARAVRGGLARQTVADRLLVHDAQVVAPLATDRTDAVGHEETPIAIATHRDRGLVARITGDQQIDRQKRRAVTSHPLAIDVALAIAMVDPRHESIRAVERSRHAGDALARRRDRESCSVERRPVERIASVVDVRRVAGEDVESVGGRHDFAVGPARRQERNRRGPADESELGSHILEASASKTICGRGIGRPDPFVDQCRRRSAVRRNDDAPESTRGEIVGIEAIEAIEAEEDLVARAVPAIAGVMISA